MRNTLKVLKDVETRKSLVAKAIRDGNVSVKDFTSLQEQYAFVYKDHSGNSALGMGRSGSANLNKSTNDYIQFIITTLEEDRDGDIVVPMGRVGKNYANNPVWFFGHQEWEIPIGTSRAPDGSIAVVSQRDKCISNFYPDRADPDAMFVFGKVQRGILNATSIAFVPLIAQRREEMYKSNPRDTRPSGWRFDSWDHTETSIVGVPANAGAIRDSLDKEKSFITPRLQKALKPYAAKSRKEQGIVWSGWCPNGDCTVKKAAKKDCGCKSKAVKKSFEQHPLMPKLIDAARRANPKYDASQWDNPAHKQSVREAQQEEIKLSRQIAAETGASAIAVANYASRQKALAESSGTSGGYTVPPCECGGKPDCPCGNKKKKSISIDSVKPATKVVAVNFLDKPKLPGYGKFIVDMRGLVKTVENVLPDGRVIVDGGGVVSSKDGLLYDTLQEANKVASELRGKSMKKKTPVKQPVAKNKPVKKADMDEEDQVMKDDAHDLIAEDIEMEEPFTVKPSAASIVKTYQHAKAEAEFLEDEIAKLDHPGIEEGLTKYKAKYVDPRMEHLKGMLHTHHAKGEGDPDEFLDKCMKGMETDGTGGSETDPGEEGMVQAGEIPPEDEVVSKRRKSVRKGEPYSEMQLAIVKYRDGFYLVDQKTGKQIDGPFSTRGEAESSLGMKSKDLEEGMSEEAEDKDLDLVEWAEQEEAEPEHEEVIDEEVGINPDEDTEEILERYQHPKNLKWYTRKVGTAKRVGNKLVLVKEAEFLEEKIIYGEDCEGEDQDDECRAMFANVGKDKDAVEEKIIYGEDCEGEDQDDECRAMFANVGKGKKKSSDCECSKEKDEDDDLSPEDMERLKQLTNRLKDYGFAI